MDCCRELRSVFDRRLEEVPPPRGRYEKLFVRALPPPPVPPTARLVGIGEAVVGVPPSGPPPKVRDRRAVVLPLLASPPRGERNDWPNAGSLHEIAPSTRARTGALAGCTLLLPLSTDDASPAPSLVDDAPRPALLSRSPSHFCSAPPQLLFALADSPPPPPDWCCCEAPPPTPMAADSRGPVVPASRARRLLVMCASRAASFSNSSCASRSSANSRSRWLS